MRRRGGRVSKALIAAAGAALLGSACGGDVKPALLMHVEARRLAADAHIRFTKAVDASNRAVMAGSDEAAAAAAKEAGAATLSLRQQITALHGVLQSLDYPNERRTLEQFEKVLADYLKTDETILTLAVENTNVKAERIAFGPARERADALRAALKHVLPAGTSRDQWHVRALVASVMASILEIQVAHARHIAESDEPVMSALEAQINAAQATARESLAALKSLLPRAAQPLADASTALDAFITRSAEIVRLSRLNTNARSLALALGRKRTLAAKCDDMLTELNEAIARHGFRGAQSI